MLGYYLYLNGAPMGWLNSAEGGDVIGDVVEGTVNSDGYMKKHIANVKWSDITLTCGTGLAKGFYEWLRASMALNGAPMDGLIIGVDTKKTEVSRIAFTKALISEVDFPAMDAAGKMPCLLTIKIAPESAQLTDGSGKPVKLPAFPKQKNWLPSNFRLSIDGLDPSLSRVNKIEAISVNRKIDPAGAVGNVSSFQFTLPAADAGSLMDWYTAFVLNGNNTEDQTRGGTLAYYAPDGSLLGVLTFSHFGIFKCTPEKVEAGNENIRRVKVELYCEEMKFDYTPAWN